MAIVTGEMSAAADGLDIGDEVRTTRTIWYTHTPVANCPLNLSLPLGAARVFKYEHDFQLMQPASESTRITVFYPVGNVTSINTDTAAGVYIDGPTHNNYNLGTPITSPEYESSGVPKLDLCTMSAITELDQGGTEVQAVAIDPEPVGDTTVFSDDPPYEVTCTDPGAWTVFNPNRSCSAFLMKYILAGNLNKLVETSRAANSMAV